MKAIKNIIVSLVLTFMVLLNIGCQKSFDYEPASLPNPNLGVDMVTYFKKYPEFYQDLSSAIERAGLEEMLSSGNYTFFAPDFRAWDRFFANSSNPYDSVDEIPVDELRSILLHHVLEGKYLASSFTENSQEFEPLYGENLTIFINNDPLRNRLNRIIVNGIQVTVSNMEPTNGAIHVIYNGLLK